MAYTRLLRVYYRRERPIGADERYRLTRSLTKSQKAAVDSVLGEFFELIDGSWKNKRADEEIASYQAQANTNQRIARERWGNEPSTNRTRSVDEPSTPEAVKRTPNQNQNQNQNQIKEEKDTPAVAGSPTKSIKKGPTPIPDDFGISEPIRTWARKEGLEPYLEAHLAYFVDYAKSKAKRYSDWNATFRNCVRSDWGNVRKMLTTAGKNGIPVAGKPWWETSTGVEAKGKELNLERAEGEAFPYFKHRVFAAAGNGPWGNVAIGAGQ